MKVPNIANVFLQDSEEKLQTLSSSGKQLFEILEQSTEFTDVQMLRMMKNLLAKKEN